jgi:hypothetical protein
VYRVLRLPFVMIVDAWLKNCKRGIMTFLLLEEEREREIHTVPKGFSVP